jgi:hypothetical protein
MSFADWIQTLLLFVTAIAACFTLYAAVVNAQLYRSHTDPEVIVYATPDESGPTLILLVVENIGRGLASEIKFRWHRPPMIAYGFGSEEPRIEKVVDGPLINGIRELGPGSRRVTIWGQYGGLRKALNDYSGTMPVTVEYLGGHRGFLGQNRRHRAVFELDVTSFDHTRDRTSDLHTIATGTEKIRKALEGPLVVKLERPRRQASPVADE